MSDEELRKLIGSRAKQRRIELNLSQQYIAEQLDVNKSTVTRYEAGTIDNTKRLIVDGLANALKVSSAWLLGETDDPEPVLSDELDIRIIDTMNRIVQKRELSQNKDADTFTKELLLYMLNCYEQLTTAIAGSSQKDSGALIKIASANPAIRNALYKKDMEALASDFNLMSVLIKLYSVDPSDAGTTLHRKLGNDRDARKTDPQIERLAAYFEKLNK